MRRWAFLGITGLFLALAATACASADESAVRQTVTDAERAWENGLAGTGTAAALDEYFATPTEGAIPAGLVETRDRWLKLLNDHVSGVSRVEISNFRVTDVQMHESGGLARLTYQINIRIVHGTQQGSAQWTQDLALIKTSARGWRIQGGDAPRLSDVVGTLPQ